MASQDEEDEDKRRAGERDIDCHRNDLFVGAKGREAAKGKRAEINFQITGRGFRERERETSSVPQTATEIR